jgi:hypothetical protein
MLLGSPVVLVNEFNLAATTVKGCTRNMEHAMTYFKESLKVDIWKLPGSERGAFIYYRDLESIVSTWFLDPGFSKALRPLPVKFANVTANTVHPMQYHFIRDIKQPCLRTRGGVFLWCGQIVHSRSMQRPVKIISFEEAAEFFGSRDVDLKIRVWIEASEFNYAVDNAIENLGVPQAPIAVFDDDLSLLRPVRCVRYSALGLNFVAQILGCAYGS